MGSEPKTCLITGGTSGIGLATVKRLADSGYHILTCGRNRERLGELQAHVLAGSSHLVKQVDLTDLDQTRMFYQQALNKHGRIDVLINNAALSPLSSFDEISAEDFENTLNVNIRSPFYLTQLAWNQMKEQGSGVIVNISSLAAVDPFPGFSIYGASKAWLDIMTHALAAEGQPHGIHVFSIRCGAVETPMLRGLFPDFPTEQCVSPAEVADKISSYIENPSDFQSGEKFVLASQN